MEVVASVVVRSLDSFAIRALREAIISQAGAQGIFATIVLTGPELQVSLRGPDGWTHAFAAALQVWSDDLESRVE